MRRGECPVGRRRRAIDGGLDPAGSIGDLWFGCGPVLRVALNPTWARLTGLGRGGWEVSSRWVRHHRARIVRGRDVTGRWAVTCETVLRGGAD